MSNTLLTSKVITREALRILHQKLNFIGNINRAYDDSFAKAGAKIGSTLRIRLPNQYKIRNGAVMQTQNTVEEEVILAVQNQMGVDIKFSSAELTLSLDDFSRIILEPAMTVLAANIESAAMVMYKDVYNEVSGVGDAISVDKSLANVLLGAKKLTDNLAPTSQRALNLNTQDNADLVNSLSGLFNPNGIVSDQYKEGEVANEFVGYKKVYQNTMWPIHTTGTATSGSYLTNISGGDGSAGLLGINTGSGTFNKGDIIMITGVYRVHPETKQSTGLLQQFVVTADYAGGSGVLNISPYAIGSSTDARQNINAPIANGVAILKVESDQTTPIAAGASYNISMGFHKDAFTFATADLVMPDGVDFAAREVQDGISMRVVRAYDINNDQFPCRLDVLFGFKAIRPQLAVRYGFHGG